MIKRLIGRNRTLHATYDIRLTEKEGLVRPWEYTVVVLGIIGELLILSNWVVLQS